ncbi:MAG: hypothetical protein RL376_957, partial [Verrucomicrobiota bacterium]
MFWTKLYVLSQFLQLHFSFIYMLLKISIAFFIVCAGYAYAEKTSDIPPSMVTAKPEPALALAKDWKKSVRPTFTLYSQIDERRTRAWIQQFEQFTAALD